MHCYYASRKIGCTCLAFRIKSSLDSRTITIIFIKDQSIIIAMSIALEHDISSLTKSDTVYEHLVMAGHENDDRLVSFFGTDEKMHDSIHDLFVSLVASGCVALILILSTLVND